jgi:hypothetical protein
MDQKAYNAYLKSDHWRDTRQRKLAINPTCERCGSTYRLEIHHRTYNNLGRESDDELETLCQLPAMRCTIWCGAASRPSVSTGAR